MNDIHRKALGAFRRCCKVDEALTVLDWQHTSYLFYPHVPFDTDNWGEWRTPVVPDGDYYIFLNAGMTLGTFGHPWKQTICVFGKQLIREFERNRPFSFEEIRRKR